MKLKIRIILVIGIALRVVCWKYTFQSVTADVAGLGLKVESFFKYFTHINATGLSFIELFFSILFILSVYFVGKVLFGENGGVISALLACFGPFILIKTSMYPTGVYNIIMFLGVIMFLISLKLHEQIHDRTKLFYFFILGFIGGMAICVNFYSICFVVPCVLFLLIARKDSSLNVLKVHKIIIWILFLFAFLAGSLPAWLSNLKYGLKMFSNIGLRDLETILVREAKDIIFLQLNRIFDMQYVFSLQGALVFIYFFSFIYLCHKLRDKLFKTRELLLVLFIIFSTVFISRVYINPALVLHPSVILYAGLPFVICYFLLFFKKRYIRIFLFSIIIFQCGEILINVFAERQKNIPKVEAQSNLMAEIKGNSIECIYTNSEIAPIVNFLNHKTIAVSSDDQSLILGTVSKNSAIIVPIDEAGVLVENSKYLCRDYVMKIFNEYVLFYSFLRPNEQQKEVLSRKWSAVANYGDEEAKYAFDRNIATRWTTNLRKIPNMYFLLDLGEDTLVDKVVVYYGKNIQDRPFGINIEGSNNREDWKELVYIKDNRDVFFWSGPHLYRRNYADRQEYYFKPVNVRYLKLNQLGHKIEDTSYWSMTEIFLYTPSGKIEAPDLNNELLIESLKNKKVDNIYADYWLFENPKDLKYIINENVKIFESSAIITDGCNIIDEVLSGYKIKYKKCLAEDFIIYYLFEGNNLKVLDKSEYICKANINQGDTRLAADGDSATRWTTSKCQEPGLYFQVDLKDEKNISGIRLWHQGSPNDYPKNIKIEILNKNSMWQKVDYVEDWTNSLFWNGFSVLRDSSMCRTYLFKPKDMKAIRCTLEGKSEYHYWSIHEIELLENLAE